MLRADGQIRRRVRGSPRDGPEPAERAARERGEALTSAAAALTAGLRQGHSGRHGGESLRLRDQVEELRGEAARERALLFALEVAPWVEQAEVLLRDSDLLDDLAVRAAAPRWNPTGEAVLCFALRRIGVLRTRGTVVLFRLRSDPEAASLSLGAATLRLLLQEIRELDRLHSRVLGWQLELLAWNGMYAFLRACAPEETLRRLKQALYRCRLARS